MARTPPENTDPSKQHMTILGSGPIPTVDLTPGAQGARLPAAAVVQDGRVSASNASVFDGQQSPAPGGEPEVREMPQRRLSDAEARAAVEPPKAFVIVNEKARRVPLKAQGQTVGGSAATMGFGKRIDPRQYDPIALKKLGVRMVAEEKFEEDATV